MAILKNPRHEAFAQAIAKGHKAVQAYKAAGYSRDRGNSVRLLSKAVIRQRIDGIRAENNKLSQIARAEALAFLADVVRTPIGQLGPQHPLTKEFLEEGRSSGLTRLKVKAHCQIAALTLIGRWCGWETGNLAETKSADVASQLLAHVVK